MTRKRLVVFGLSHELRLFENQRPWILFFSGSPSPALNSSPKSRSYVLVKMMRLLLKKRYLSINPHLEWNVICSSLSLIGVYVFSKLLGGLAATHPPLLRRCSLRTTPNVFQSLSKLLYIFASKIHIKKLKLPCNISNFVTPQGKLKASNPAIVWGTLYICISLPGMHQKLRLVFWPFRSKSKQCDLLIKHHPTIDQVLSIANRFFV